MPSYKLVYFDAKWLGEGIRLILSYMGKEFEDVRIMSSFRAESPWHQMKPDIKFGKLPYLEIDGERLYQSQAICRYLASEAKLLGANDWENAQIDVIAGTIVDLTKAVQVAFLEKNQEAKAEKKKELLEKTIPYYLELYDGIVGENGYLANGKLSWVDFYFVGAMETLPLIFEVHELQYEKYSNLVTLKKKLYAIPKVKEWIDQRELAKTK